MRHFTSISSVAALLLALFVVARARSELSRAELAEFENEHDVSNHYVVASRVSRLLDGDDEEDEKHEGEEHEGEEHEGEEHEGEEHEAHEHEGEEHEAHEHEGEEHEGEEHEAHEHEGEEHEAHEHEGEEHEAHEHEEQSNSNKPWGEVLLSTFLINVVTIAGVIVLVPIVTRVSRTESFCSSVKGLFRTTPRGDSDIPLKIQKRRAIFDIAMSSFACGAILATAVFLIIPEAILLITRTSGGEEHEEDHEEDHMEGETEEEHDEHAGHGDHAGEDSVWKFGTAFLGGFLLPIVLAAIFPRASEHECDNECVQGPESQTLAAESQTFGAAEEASTSSDDVEVAVSADKDGDKSISQGTMSTHPTHTHDGIKQGHTINWRLCASVLIGDFFHNFADGIFVGTAFMLCTNSVAITIVLATVYHEIAQELADFFLLTNHGGLAPLYALLVNFVCGLSVMLGGIVVLASNPSEEAVGVILAVSSGVYIHLAASECLPRVNQLLATGKDRLISMLFFVLGAVPIGLVLLSHSHCDAEDH